MFNRFKKKKEYRLEHSKMAKIALGLMISPIIPFLLYFLFVLGIFPLLNTYDQVLWFSNIMVYWTIGMPLLALLISISDLLKPYRARVIPAIILIIWLCVLVCVIIINLSDLQKIYHLIF